jgi:hypothetical protein
MKKPEYIESVYDRCLKKHQQELVSQFISSIRNEHGKFKPYNSNPKHYIISIYDPLQLHYVLLGATNLGVNLEFKDENKIDNELVTRFKLNIDDPDSKYSSEVIQFKREIEYYFLQKVLIEIQKTLGVEIHLYITQHITEVSFDITNMKSIDSEYLWENLEN